MRCAGLLLCLVALSLWPAVAQGAAPAEPEIQQLRVQVMPEFDDPRVLVIVQGRLALGSIESPLTFTVRVPHGAQINQMATMNMVTGGTTAQPFEVAADPDDARWSLVSYTLDNPHFFYEYYYDTLGDQVDKEFTFAFSSRWPVGEMLLEVQEPLAATGFSLDPMPGSVRQDKDFGLAYHQFDVGALGPGEEFTVRVGYAKSDPAPSVSRAEMMSVGMPGLVPDAVPPMAGMQRTGGTVPTWIFFMLGSVLVVGLAGVVWYRVQVTRAALAPAREASQGATCRQCDIALRPSARFCHFCGSRVQAD
jgi:hypothetical protein